MNQILTTDIKITEKKNMYGEIFEVDNLSYDELSLYMDCLVEFEGKKYWVSSFDHIVYEKAEDSVYKGKKKIS